MIASPSAFHTRSLTCWSVVSLYTILSKFSLDNSSSSSSGSKVSKTKSAALACNTVQSTERSAEALVRPRVLTAHTVGACGEMRRPSRGVPILLNAPCSWNESVLGTRTRPSNSRRPDINQHTHAQSPSCCRRRMGTRSQALSACQLSTRKVRPSSIFASPSV